MTIIHNTARCDSSPVDADVDDCPGHHCSASFGSVRADSICRSREHNRVRHQASRAVRAQPVSAQQSPTTLKNFHLICWPVDASLAPPAPVGYQALPHRSWLNNITSALARTSLKWLLAPRDIPGVRSSADAADGGRHAPFQDERTISGWRSSTRWLCSARGVTALPKGRSPTSLVYT